MKKVYAFLMGCLCFSYAHAINYVWVGPIGGNYSDPQNWSLNGAPGTGGAGVPGAADGVSFTFNFTNVRTFVVNVDVSPTVNTFSVDALSDVTLFTSKNTVFTVTNQFSLRGSMLDSTSEDVKFDFVLSNITASFTSVGNMPSWSFSGRVPVSSGNGAMFTTAAGTSFTVGNLCSILSKSNAGDIVSTPATLRFNAGSSYVLDNNLNGAIPAATWDARLATGALPAAPVIFINGDARSIRHSANTAYGSIVVNLSNLSSDANLALPNGTVLKENLTIQNTNNYTLTLLDAAGSAFDSVKLEGLRGGSGGIFTVAGSTSKVALASAPASAPETPYRLDVRDFVQTGGNFSLQDASNYTGASTLTVRRNFNETGGTFITNSTSTSSQARFAVEFLGPFYIDAPSGPAFDGHNINASSGSIDNAAHMVILRVADVPFTYFLNGTQTSQIGTTLTSPLQVGKLELNGGPIFTTAANLLTVASPSPSAVQTTTTNSYVNGPVRRMTNSINAYMLPTGKGTRLVFNLDTCVVIPVSTTPSVYQAEYFNTPYTNTTVAPPFRGVANNEYWDISKVSGADAQVQLILNNPVPSATATDNLVVAHYTGGQWVNEQGTILSPGNAATGSVISKPLSGFSPFTFGYGSFINAPLAVHLISFSGHSENGGARLNWKVADKASRFEVLRATDGISYSQVGTVAASAVLQEYTFLDSKLQPGMNYYRLRSIEQDGTASLSDVITINSTNHAAELLTLAPTVVTATARLQINAATDGRLELMVTDMAGRSWKKLVLPVRAGSSSATINLSDLPAGTYQIGGYINGKKTAVIRFVKQ